MVMNQSNLNSLSPNVVLGGGSLVRVFDWLFVLRPTLMFPLWTMVLCGIRLSSRTSQLQLTQWLWLVFGLSALFGLVYLLNQLRDEESDRRNDKLHLVSAGICSRGRLLVESAVLAASI